MSENYWWIWQPRVTHVLKSMNEQLFHDIALEFTLIMDSKITAGIIKYKEKWMIFFNSVDNGSLRLWLSLHDPAQEEYSSSGFEMNTPTIDIHDFLIRPKGQGLGTKIIFKFLENIQKTKFEKIILRAESPRAAHFWERFGFQYREGHNGGMPPMWMDLTPMIEEIEVKVNLRYKHSGRNL